jgi:hypothetical protein
VPNGVPVGVDYGHAELAAGVSRGCLGEPAGDPSIKGAEAAGLPRPLPDAVGGEERDVQVPEDEVDLRRDGRVGIATAAAAGSVVAETAAGATALWAGAAAGWSALRLSARVVVAP